MNGLNTAVRTVATSCNGGLKKRRLFAEEPVRVAARTWSLATVWPGNVVMFGRRSGLQNARLREPGRGRSALPGSRNASAGAESGRDALALSGSRNNAVGAKTGRGRAAGFL